MDCIDLFKRAAMALQTDPRYLALDQARKANDKNEELQNLIGEFNLARMDLNNEISKSERSDEMCIRDSPDPPPWEQLSWFLLQPRQSRPRSDSRTAEPWRQRSARQGRWHSAPPPYTAQYPVW